MISPQEFTVGSIGSAAPLSLILPRNQYEETVLVGHIGGEPAAVFLTGQHRFQFFCCAGNDNWTGIVIPGVRIEVDETRISDMGSGTPLGCAVRSDTRLTVRAKSERSYSSTTAVTLHDELSSAGDHSAGFMRWQVVLGTGDEKRVLTEIDLTLKAET